MTNILLIILLTAASAFAQVRDTELKVERRTLDRQDKLNKPRRNAEELTRGLKITVKNPGTKSAAEGEVEWAIIVQRPGMQKNLLSSGKETLKALKAGETAILNVGAVPVQDVGNHRQDMEYQVIVRRAGTESAKAESTPAFSQQAEAARKMEKKSRKEK